MPVSLTRCPMFMPIICRLWLTAEDCRNHFWGYLTKIKWTNEQHVNSLDSSNFVHGLKSFLGLNLNHSQDILIGLVKVFERRDSGAKLLSRIRRSKASLPQRGKLGGLDEILGLFDGTQ